MEQSKIETNTQWKSFYKMAGTMAILIALAGIIDVISSKGFEAIDNRSVSVTEWFTLFQTNRFHAFSSLGVINIITLSLGIPIYLALYHAHRQERPALSALAAVLFFIGCAIYFSSNTVFSFYALGRQYAAAAEAQKPVLEAAGGALLAQGADLTPGTFMGFLLTQSAGLLITSLMLCGRVFGKPVAMAGLAGYALTSIFFILAAFASENYDTAMVFAMTGSLLLMAYQIMLGISLFQPGRL
jgi:hypothetical protein